MRPQRILAQQNLCHFLKVSEQIMYGFKQLLMRNSGRLLLFPSGIWMDFLMHQPALLHGCQVAKAMPNVSLHKSLRTPNKLRTKFSYRI